MGIIRKLMDISGIPFIIEERESGRYIVGVKVRKREFKIEGTGIPVELEEKLGGPNNDGKINTLGEMEEALKNIPEGKGLDEYIEENSGGDVEYVDDSEVVDTWQQMMNQSGNKPE